MNHATVELHEASHAAAFMERGYPLARVRSRGGLYGFCEPKGGMGAVDGESAEFAALAGQFGPRLIGVFDDRPSVDDCESVRSWGHELAAKRRALERWVWWREAEIRAVAEALAARGELFETDLARLCHAPGSPLAEFARLYPRPAPPAALSSAPPKTSPVAGVRWSDEHRCFLRRKPGPAQVCRVTVAGAFR